MARVECSASVLLTLVTCSLLLLSYSPISDAARIVAFNYSPSKSHQLIHCAIADTLARAGHDVTVIAGVPNVYKKAQYKYIELTARRFDDSFMKEMVNKPQPMYKTFGSLMSTIGESANHTFNDPKMRHFLAENGPGSVDLLLIGYFMNDFHLGLAGHFRCPIIISFMIQPVSMVNKFLGNPNEFAYVPSLLGAEKQPMNFLHRVKNYILGTVEEQILSRILANTANKYYNYNFPADRYPSLDEVRKNISLIFCNHHFSQGPIRPNVPNLIEIGGIQIKEKPDPLPTDIAKVLDEHKEGVIYFSLGSNIQGTHLTPEKAKIMFNVISKLPYKVLWKWGDADYPGKSANIIYKSWLPQDDILAHPNVKLFITHGGMGSVVESQYHGVPMVGIPLFGDQPSNMANVKRSGFGASVDYATMTEESLNNAIQEVLNKPQYTEAVQRFSKLYRDRPMTTRELVVYWTEYVLRHKGAKHMQSPAVYLNGWQLMSLDVLAFLLAIISTVIFVFVKICKFLCCRKKKTAAVTKKKKNK